MLPENLEQWGLAAVQSYLFEQLMRAHIMRTADMYEKMVEAYWICAVFHKSTSK